MKQKMANKQVELTAVFMPHKKIYVWVCFLDF